MAVTERLRTVGTWSGAGVDAGAVQGQLTRLWKAATQADAAGRAAARTNVLTLVAYADTEAGSARVGEVVETLVERHPSRTILVLAEPGAEPALDAEVSTRCRLDRPHVCHEQILLRARGPDVEQVTSAVSSLLLRDLPTFLWWPGDVHGQAELLPRLAALCQRLIVDSVGFAEPLAGLRALLRLPGGGHPAVSDMAWARLGSWREAVAQLFDPAEARAELPRLGQVTIELTPQPGVPLPAAGLLVAAWLGSRLGWRPLSVDPAARRLAVETAGGRAEVEFREADGEGPAGQPVAIRLEATTAGRRAAFSAERQGPERVATRAEGPQVAQAERGVRLAALPDAALLSQELGMFEHDRVYEAALGWLGELPAGTGGGE